MNIKKINTILIANRGEIAARIIKTAKKLNIKTITIYSDFDKNAPFTRLSDISVPLNGNNNKDTYFNVDKIIQIAKKYNVDAIHPGYGFLSENIEFVKQLENQNIRFIGPSSHSMNMVGDKFNAKKLVEKLNIKTASFSNTLIKDLNQAKQNAEKIGYPVIIKAINGGGGKGIKIVYNEDELEEKIKNAQYEAKTIYKNDDIIMEKYIENARHIEIQVIADKYNNIVCLGERDCSIQRFNQKIIEEAPSPFIDEDTRKKMYQYAKNIFQECKYYSSGTVEFLVDKEKNIYFLEVNTRIQVEHPITEFITGLDIVELMINIEEGEKLNIKQEDIKLKGHAFECRICAENPANNFIPSIGKIIHYIEPEYNENIRIDSGVELGSNTSCYSDTMISKVITYGNTRNEAIELMKDALSQYEIDGIETNINFMENIFRQNDFINGNITTSFIKKNYPNGFNSLKLTDNTKKAFISTAIVLYIKELKYNFNINKNCFIPRNTDISTLYVVINNESYCISIIDYKDDFLKIKYNSEYIQIKFNYQYGDIFFKSYLNGINPFLIKIKKNNNEYILSCAGICQKINVYDQEIYKLINYMPKIHKITKPQFLISQISGTIIDIYCKEGQIIKKGEKLLLIDSMKIENIILCEYDAKIIKIYKKADDHINNNEKIIEFEYFD